MEHDEASRRKMLLRVVPVTITESSELIPPFDTDEERCWMLLDVSDKLEEGVEMFLSMISRGSETRNIFVRIGNARHSGRHQVAHCAKK